MGDKQNRSGILDKSQKNEKGNLKQIRNKKLFWWTFWSIFIGSSVFVAIPLWLKVLSEKPAHSSSKLRSVNNTTPTAVNKALKEIEKLKAIEYIENKKQEIFARAWERSYPRIEELRKKITENVAKFTDRQLDRYFKNIEKYNVDKFLDWLYSFGTDYKIAFFESKEEIEKLLAEKKCFDKKKLSECKRLIKPSDYLQKQVSKYLINSTDLEKYIKKEILPYYEKQIKTFVDKSYEILRAEVKGVAAEMAKERFPDLKEIDLEEVVNNFTVKMNYELKVNSLERIGVKVVNAVVAAVIFKLLTKTLPKKLAAKIAAKIGEKILAKMAAKAGSKLAGAGSGFAAGTALCLEFGPLSVLCGIAAAAAAAIATDIAINKIDELITRDDFKTELVKDLEDLKKKLHSDLLKNFKDALTKVELEMRNTFGGKAIKLKEIPNLEK